MSKSRAINNNPVDEILTKISDVIDPVFKKMNYTPNGLTSVSVVFVIAALYHLYNRNLPQFTIYFILYYLFDNMDGNYARKYNMVSKLGDMYDHYKDIVVVIVFAYILYAKYNIVKFPVLLLLFSVLIVLSILFVGCREKIDGDKHTVILNNFGGVLMSGKDCKKNIPYLKWFGTGTLFVGALGLVWYLDTQCVKPQSVSSYIDISNL